jgi:hypothetical protein
LAQIELRLIDSRSGGNFDRASAVVSHRKYQTSGSAACALSHPPARMRAEHHF